MAGEGELSSSLPLMGRVETAKPSGVGWPHHPLGLASRATSLIPGEEGRYIAFQLTRSLSRRMRSQSQPPGEGRGAGFAAPTVSGRARQA